MIAAQNLHRFVSVHNRYRSITHCLLSVSTQAIMSMVLLLIYHPGKLVDNLSSIGQVIKVACKIYRIPGSIGLKMWSILDLLEMLSS